MTENIVAYQFGPDQVRTLVDEKGEPWFCLADLLSGTQSTTTTAQAKALLEPEFGDGGVIVSPIIDNLGRQQQAAFVSEPAMYFLLFRGRKGKSKLVAKLLLKQIKDYRYILQALQDFEVPSDLPDMYVYAIKNKVTGNVKIGISYDPVKRLKQLQTGNDCELELLAVRKAENRFNDEAALHNKFSEYRLNGEWFSGQITETVEN